MNDEGFDFQQVSEEPEELDSNKLNPCPHCKKPIPEDATMCYYCGKEAYRSSKPAWVFWTAIIVIIAFTLFLLTAI